LNNALLAAATKGAGSTEKINAVYLAKAINHLSGGAVVAPWEIDTLDQEWIDTFWLMLVDLPKAQQNSQEIESIKEKIRREHPTFGKRYKNK